MIAVLCAFGCQSGRSAPDAAQSYDQPIGATCNEMESLLCASGAGICDGSVCSAFCGPDEASRCPAGTTQAVVTDGSHLVCVCVRS